MKAALFAVLIASQVSIASQAGAAPRLVPMRDVTIDYSVQPRDHAALSIHAEIEGGGRRLRITSPDLPTALLVDRPAGVATIMLPMLKLFATAPIGQYDPERTVLRGASFMPLGQSRIAGLACTDWAAMSAHGRATGCVTDDGVILRGEATDSHGRATIVRATTVQYGPLPPLLFVLPDDYRNAGTLPIEGFGQR